MIAWDPWKSCAIPMDPITVQITLCPVYPTYMLKRTLLFTSIFLLGGHWIGAQTSIALVPEATGLDDIVDISHAGDERIFCTLQPGTIMIVLNGSVLPMPFLDITDRVTFGGERGLLGLAFDPNFDTNGWFYVNYTASDPDLVTRISRFTVPDSTPNLADPNSEEIVYTWPQPYGNHNGGDLDFGPDGMLYIGFGDGGSGGDPQNHAQTLTDPLGDLLRIDVSLPGDTFLIPADNPYASSIDTLPEIWANGLRNPWRFGFDALSGDLWIGDVGQGNWEEIDFWPAEDNSGPNFGWRCYEGFAPYDTAGCGPAANYVQPIVVQPNLPWCSIIGGRVYRGSAFSSLYGRFIYSDYCEGEFRSLTPDGVGGWVDELLLATQDQGFVVIAEDSALELYAGNKNQGILYHIVDPMMAITERGDVSFAVFPNPATDRLIVEGELSMVRMLALSDASGRLMLQEPMNNGSRATIDISAMANGTYILRLTDGAGKVIGRRLVNVSR